MALPLTRRQKQILDFIAHWIKSKGYAPSLQEIGDELGMHALATVHKHLTNLEEKGYISRTWNRSRSITLLTIDGCCPTCGQTMPQAGALEMVGRS